MRSVLFSLLFLSFSLFASLPSVLAATLPDGCAGEVTEPFSAGFVATEYSLQNVAVDPDNGALALLTGESVIDPDKIVIPFEQEVWASFFFENAGNTSTLGWMLYSDATDSADNFKGWSSIPDNLKHPIFGKVQDDSFGGDGVLELDFANNFREPASEEELEAFPDPHGEGKFVVDNDGLVSPKDMRKSLGRFDAGTEIVFWLANGNGDWGPTESDNVFYTKKDWNPDTFGACISPSPRTYELGVANNDELKYPTGSPYERENRCKNIPKGLLEQGGIDRLKTEFNLTLEGESEVSVAQGAKFKHAISAAPSEDPNQWILSWEDTSKGGDMDYNDITFRIERQTGGSVALNSTEAITPANTDAFFTAVTFKVYDEVPSETCVGKTSIEYLISINGGTSWVEVRDWDLVKSFSWNGTDKNLGDKLTGWTPGAPTLTYREARIDFAALDQVGQKLLWKANLKSDSDTCVPKIHGVSLTGETVTNDSFSRSAPVKLVNMLYSSSYETPAIGWAEKTGLRGHVKATRLYDPNNPETSSVELQWDAGNSLAKTPVAIPSGGTSPSPIVPDSRTIYYPDITVTSVTSENLTFNNGMTTGDDTTKEFSGVLYNSPILAGSVKIASGTKVFRDKGTDILYGNDGTGTINRFTGEYTLNFSAPPANGPTFTADYTWYKTASTPKTFTTTNISNAMLQIDDSVQSPGGYIYDLHKDSSVTEDDGDWLVQWVRGYAKGPVSLVPPAGWTIANADQKEWKLGAIDHSAPALLTPPGKTSWYFGTGTKPQERNSYDIYRTNFNDRRTVLFVGARDGLVHAFDAGAFRWGDNGATGSIIEKLGYFAWSDLGNGYSEPDYGTGEELWAFVPVNLLPRLKNNLLEANDRAFVDATATVSHVQMDYASNDEAECLSRGGSLVSGVCKGGWHSVLLMAEGNGGDSVFCLDVTYQNSPTFLWEFTDPDLYRSRTSPNVSKIGRIMVGGKSTWAAFFVSGKTYDDNLYPSVYVIDIADGSVIKRIFLDSDVAGKGGVPSGRPTLVDTDQNGYVDRIYLGTDKGRVYKINLSDDPLAAYFEADDLVVNGDFVDESGDVDVSGNPVSVEVPMAQRWHPVYAAPTIVNETTIDEQGHLDYKVRIFFGTGDSPYYDEDIDIGNTTYHFFSYLDTAEKGDMDSGNVELDWFYELPSGQRTFASAFASAGQVYFGTSTAETENPCDANNDGETYIFDFNQPASAQPLKTLNTGNISTRLLVDDEKLFISNSKGLSVHGDGTGYEKDKKDRGFGTFERKAWREVE